MTDTTPTLDWDARCGTASATGTNGFTYRVTEHNDGWVVTALAVDVSGEHVCVETEGRLVTFQDAQDAAQVMYARHLRQVQRARLTEGVPTDGKGDAVRIVTSTGERVTSWSAPGGCVFLADREVVYVPSVDQPGPVAVNLAQGSHGVVARTVFTPIPPSTSVRRDTPLGYITITAQTPVAAEAAAWLFAGTHDGTDFTVRVARLHDDDLCITVHADGDHETRVRTEQAVTPVIVTEYATMSDATMLPLLGD